MLQKTCDVVEKKMDVEGVTESLNVHHWSCVSFTGAASLFSIQKLLQRKLPYPLQWNVLISVGEK